jgi:thioester reductase-like protein
MEAGLDGVVMRPGGIMAANDRTARLHLKDALTAYLLLSLKLGAVPDFGTAPIDFTPVDYVAEGVCR